MRVAPNGVLAHVESQPPLTIRRIRGDDPGVCALCLVGTAAGPLDGDDLTLDLAVADGAAATLVATGASIAQGGASAYRTSVQIGTGGSLHARPGALIVSAGAHVDVPLDLELAADATLDWQEVVVLGRSGQTPGTAVLRWDVTRAGRPVLRQRVDLAVSSWRGVLDGNRVLATALRTGPSFRARTVVRSQTSVAARLDEHTVLVTVLALDAATATRELAALTGDS